MMLTTIFYQAGCDNLAYHFIFINAFYTPLYRPFANVEDGATRQGAPLNLVYIGGGVLAPKAYASL
jgi:hypothetical protein